MPATATSARASITLTPARYAALLCLVCLGTMFFRSPGLLLHPRLWCEEGIYYFAAMQLPQTSVWTYVFRGNYQFLVNLATGIASMLPAAYAAYVTTAVSLLTLLAAVALFGLLAHERAWSFATAAATVVAICLLPQGYEVYLTATNVHWVASVSVVLLTALRVEDWSRSAKVLGVAWMAVCAFSGIPAVVLTPVVLARAVLTRSRVHAVMAALLSVACAVQLTLVLTHPILASREFVFDPLVFLEAFLAQGVVSPLLGVGLTDSYVAAMRNGALVPLLALSAMALALGWAFFKAIDATPRGRTLAIVLGASALLSASVNAWGSMGTLNHLVHPWENGRYLILAATCWLMVLCAAANSPLPLFRALAIACLASAVFFGLWEAVFGSWKDYLLAGGVPWMQMVDGCGLHRPCQVTVWPGGLHGWSFILVRP